MMSFSDYRIGTKLAIGFGAVLVMFVLYAAMTLVSMGKIGANVHQVRNKSVPFALLAEEMAFDVSQVQQFLTDVGATRDPEAFKEADEAAARFHGSIAKFKEMYRQENDAKALREIEEIDKEFGSFHQLGRQMAEAYIKEGTVGGNRIMRDFDKASEVITEKVQGFKKLQVDEANQMTGRVEEIIKTLKTAIMAIGLFTILIGVFCAVLITRVISRPLCRTVSAIDRIATGDLTVKLPQQGKDETAMLATSVNRMVMDMNSVIEALAKASNHLSSASTELVAQAELMAKGAEEVSAQTDAVAAASHEMATTSQEIANNCTMAADSTDQAHNKALAGSEVIRKTVVNMELISDKVQHAAKSVTSLGARSDQIGVIVGTIEDIADQTNLLALNAAIEAARAGDQGRGFAVVADEVRALAGRTALATKEITAMIRSIQQETGVAVESMEAGVAEVASGADGAIKSAKSLDEILEQVKAVTTQVSQIAVASEQQTATTSEISINIQQINDVIVSNSRGAEETAVAAKTLSALSEELLMHVRRFKLAS